MLSIVFDIYFLPPSLRKVSLAGSMPAGAELTQLTTTCQEPDSGHVVSSGSTLKESIVMTHTAQGPWQRLLNLARPQKNRLIVGTIFLAIGSGLGLLYPQAVRIIIDDALGNRDLELIKNAALGLVAVFALQGVAIGLRAYLFTIAGEHVVTNLRNDLFSRIVSQELGIFGRKQNR